LNLVYVQNVEAERCEMDLNRELHEAFGLVGKEDWSSMADVKIEGLWYPDYKAGPRLVIREMEKAGKLKEFVFLY